MSKKKTIITLFLACIVIYSSFFIINFTVKNNDNVDNEEFLNTLLKDNEADFSYKTLTSIKPSDIKAFTCRTDGKEVIYTKIDDEWICNLSDGVKDKISVSYALNTLADIKIYQGDGIEVLEENEENVKKCGLDSGFEITITFVDDTVSTYRVGNYLQFGAAYYFTCGDGKIYTVLNRFTSAITSLFD